MPSFSRPIRGLVAAAALLMPVAAHAATHFSMDFSGTVQPDANGNVSPYLDSPSSTSFAGEKPK